MKKIAMGIVIVTLLSGLAVCNAQSSTQEGDTVPENCKDGVCEFVPSYNSGGTGDTLAVNVNPYNNAVPDIEAKWEKDMQLGPHDTFIADKSEAQVGIVFFVHHPVENFKFLSLRFKEIGIDGRPIFQVDELYTKDILRPERPLLVRTSFTGTIPNNGISYTDSDGKTRYYSISQSGKDGSVEFGEI